MNRFRRTDFSNYVVHFTKDSSFCIPSDPRGATIGGLTAKDRFLSILSQRKIIATNMPWTNKPAVCFTECTWSSMIGHAKQYSKYGIGFSKDFLFAHGGAPAIYLTPGLMEHQKAHVGPPNLPFDETLFSFITPFCPHYAPTAYKDRFWKKKPIDYSHEREWRVPHDLDFSLGDVAFVIVAIYDDMAKADRGLKDGIGREKWFLMDNYERIEELWPTHRY